MLLVLYIQFNIYQIHIFKIPNIGNSLFFMFVCLFCYSLHYWSENNIVCESFAVCGDLLATGLHRVAGFHEVTCPHSSCLGFSFSVRHSKALFNFSRMFCCFSFFLVRIIVFPLLLTFFGYLFILKYVCLMFFVVFSGKIDRNASLPFIGNLCLCFSIPLSYLV